jgi:hypothetical protein
LDKTIKTCREQVSALEVKMSAKTISTEDNKKDKHADPELHEEYNKLK